MLDPVTIQGEKCPTTGNMVALDSVTNPESSGWESTFGKVIKVAIGEKNPFMKFGSGFEKFKMKADPVGCPNPKVLLCMAPHSKDGLKDLATVKGQLAARANGTSVSQVCGQMHFLEGFISNSVPKRQNPFR